MGFLTEDVITKMGDKSAEKAEAAAKETFSEIVTRVARQVETAADGDPYRTRTLLDQLRNRLNDGGAIFALSDSSPSSSPKEVPAAPDPKNDIDPLTPQNDNERNAVNAVRHHDLVVNDEGEVEQLGELRKALAELNEALDDVDEVLSDGTLPADRSTKARVARMTAELKRLKDKPEKDQEEIMDTLADSIGEKHRARNESLDRYQQRVDAALKAKLAATGKSGAIDLKPIAQALNKPEDTPFPELVTAAGQAAQNAAAWEGAGTEVNAKVKEITGLDSNANESHVQYVVRGLQQGPANGGKKRGGLHLPGGRA